MYYRILDAPPGYPHDCKYMVAAYETLEYSTCVGSVLGNDGRRFVRTIEEARELIPKPRVQLPFDRDAQFLELWESEILRL